MEQSIPIGMIATRLHRAFEDECFARLSAAGYSDLRMRHSVLLQSLPPEGARITDLAVELGMTKQAMGELVDDLEQHGYLTRESDPTDRRARRIRYTSKGTDALQRAFVIITELEREYAALVGETRYAEARATFVELLAALGEAG